MDISAKEVIFMCEDVPILYPQVKEHTLVNISPNARIHIHYEDMDVYMVVSKNQKKLFYDLNYYGILYVYRRKGIKSNDKSLAVYPMCFCGDAAVVDNRQNSNVTALGDTWAHNVFINSDSETKQLFQDALRELYEHDPITFEQHWGKYLCNRPHFRRDISGITF
jgi:hypothetical protein